MITSIRPAQVFDVPFIHSCICGLAEYERLLHEVTTDEYTLRQNLFGDSPKAHVIIAEYNGTPCGFALYFYNFSTFVGKPGIYLEDLYVYPEYRGKGIGKQLMAYLADKAEKEGCCKLEWCVLRWNMPAIAMYEGLGAENLDEWKMYQVTDHHLHDLAVQYQPYPQALPSLPFVAGNGYHPYAASVPQNGYRQNEPLAS